MKTTGATLTSYAVLLAGLMACVAAAQEAPRSDDLAAVALEMQREVEALRGWKFKEPVDVGVFTEEQVRQFLQSDDAEAPCAAEQYSRDETAKKMIGLIPPDGDSAKEFEDMMMSFVPGGIYDHRKNLLRVVKKDDRPAGSLSVRLTLAHELTHALDDQHFNLDNLLGAEGMTSDASHVSGAIFEGSAVLLQERYRHKAKLSGRFPQTEFDQSNAEASSEMQSMAQAPPHVAVWTARFPCGMRFLFRGDSMPAMKLFSGFGDPGSVGDAVRAAAADMPRSFEQILHPEKYWQADQLDNPIVINDADMDELLTREKLHIVHRDTFGELLCAVVSSSAKKRLSPMSMGMPSYWTNDAATGWGGDRFYLLAVDPERRDTKQRGKTLRGIWLTVWDTPADRGEFVEAYKKHRNLPTHSFFELGESAAVFLFGFDTAARTELEKHLTETPPRMSRDGKPWPASTAS